MTKSLSGKISRSRENTAAMFEKPETRNQFIDSKMRPIEDKAWIAVDAGGAGEILRSKSEFDPRCNYVSAEVTDP